MTVNKVPSDIEAEIIQSITEMSEWSGLPVETIIKIIWEAVFDERSGKTEDECRRIMSEKIDRYKVERLAHSTTR